jgi:hypothetical protein
MAGVDRRQFLHASLAAPLLPRTLLSEPAAVTASGSPLDLVPLYRVVCDDRFAPSVDFAADAARRGIHVVRTTGDITDFWFEELSLRWGTAPAAVAGLTAEGPLFCLERLGWDHGLRVVFREPHGVASSADEPLVTWVVAPRPRANALPQS